jgi:predicted  nucleic acid-binding Zn-ribbon protein
MDQELIAYLDERFRATTEQISGLRQEVRQTHVVVEGLRGEIQLLAEGLIGMEEKLQSFRNEVSFQFNEVRKSIELPFKNLDVRVSFLEERAALEGQAPLDIIRERYGKKTA